MAAKEKSFQAIMMNLKFRNIHRRKNEMNFHKIKFYEKRKKLTRKKDRGLFTISLSSIVLS